jgi:hypothetical protein
MYLSMTLPGQDPENTSCFLSHALFIKSIAFNRSTNINNEALQYAI